MRGESESAEDVCADVCSPFAIIRWSVVFNLTRKSQVYPYRRAGVAAGGAFGGLRRFRILVVNVRVSGSHQHHTWGTRLGRAIT